MDTKFTTLWGEFSTPLKKFIGKRVANEHDTDDILQEVFARIYKNINTLKEEKKIHAWVYRITRNVIVDFYREKKSTVLTELTEDLIAEMDEDLSVNEEVSACVKAMINHLPEKYKEAIILTEYHNLTQKELSTRLGLSVSGAKSRVQRGREMIKNMILDCCTLEFDKNGSIIDYKYKSKGCNSC